jgi:uncharacterized protein YkwD
MRAALFAGMPSRTTSLTGKVLLCAASLFCVSAPSSMAHAQCRPPAPPAPPPWVTLPWLLPFPPPAEVRVNLPPLPNPWGLPLPSPAPPAAPAQPPSQAANDGWPDAWTRFEDETLVLTNQRRAMGAVCGDRAFGPALPLAMDAALRRAAREHSRDMGSRSYFSHDSPDGRSPDDRMRAAGWSGKSSGENIYGGPPTAAAVVDGWVKSPGHCANLMGPGYRSIGIGYADVPGSPLHNYWTQDFGG